MVRTGTSTTKQQMIIKHASHRLFLSQILLILLLIVGFFLSFGSVIAEDAAATNDKKTLVDTHHKRSRQCFECHLDVESPAFKTILKNNCIECHKSGWVKGKLEQLAKEPDMSNSLATEKASGQGPGMNVPMYYENSKLGDKLNELILIPAGDFIRGTNNRLPDEGPQHVVNVKAFYIDKYEVTNLQYKKFLDSTGHIPPSLFIQGMPPKGKVDHPVVYVSWFDAKKYCGWAGKRLPDDKEWEKAARGTDGRSYPWGDEFSIERVNSPVRWSNLNLIGDTTPAGAFDGGVSPYGLHDTSGNVWEWTSSRYEAYPGNKRKSENYGGNYRTLKGGSWWDCSFYQCGISAPLYNRSFFHPKTKNNSFGFRCAKDG